MESYDQLTPEETKRVYTTVRINDIEYISLLNLVIIILSSLQNTPFISVFMSLTLPNYATKSIINLYCR